MTILRLTLTRFTANFLPKFPFRIPPSSKGSFRPVCSGYVTEWAVLHEEELQRCWNAAQGDAPIGKMPPLV